MKNVSLFDNSFHLKPLPGKISGSFILCLIILIFQVFSGCKKDNNDPEIPPAEEEYVIATVSGTIGAGGGTLSLSDGATIVVDAGVIESDVEVKFNKLGNEKNFAADNRSCYELKGLPEGIRIKLTFPCEKNKPQRHVGVYNYDPENHTGMIPDFTYDPSAGKITIDNYTSQKKFKNPDPAKYTRWIMEWSDDIGTGNDAKIITVPYYEQVIGTCWAADAMMLAKSYLSNGNKELNESSTGAFMRYMDLSINAGVDMNIFKRLKAPFALYSGGITAKVEEYFWTDNLLKKIIEKIKEDKPVIIFMPNLGHSVLVVGYRTYTNTSGYDEWELVIHDSKGIHPPSADEGGIYTTRKWSWFIDTYYPLNTIGILYADQPISAERSLQTVIMPTSEQPQSFITFTYKKPGGQPGFFRLKFDETKENNHVWVNAMEKVQDTLPTEVTQLNLRLQIYNADWDPSFFNKNGIVEVTVFNRDKNQTTCQKEYTFGMPSESQIPAYLTQSIDTAEWYRPMGDTNQTNYLIRVRLLDDAKTYLDGFTAFFTIKNPKPDQIKIGGKYQGGIIGYLLLPGDPGYDSKVPHGLIVANPGPAGVSMWGCRGTAVGTTEAGLGTGASNTQKIAAACEESMAKICSDLVINGYSDWYMPSIGELNILFENRVAIGCIADGWYFSSTEYNLGGWYPPSDYVYGQNFPSGAQQWLYKENTPLILAIRSF